MLTGIRARIKIKRVINNAIESMNATTSVQSLVEGKLGYRVTNNSGFKTRGNQSANFVDQHHNLRTQKATCEPLQQ